MRISTSALFEMQGLVKKLTLPFPLVEAITKAANAKTMNKAMNKAKRCPIDASSLDVRYYHTNY